MDKTREFIYTATCSECEQVRDDVRLVLDRDGSASHAECLECYIVARVRLVRLKALGEFGYGEGYAGIAGIG